MNVTCISDLHGNYDLDLPGGDLLIIAGDLTCNNSEKESKRFCSFLEMCNQYKKKVVIAGNHDNLFVGVPPHKAPHPVKGKSEWYEYLCDSGTEFKGVKIWGSPWTKAFQGMNPKCKAFTCNTDEELDEKWKGIPDDIDILVTHSPPYGIHDTVRMRGSEGFEHVGSLSLRNHVLCSSIRLHVFGHTHKWGGRRTNTNSKAFVNASVVDENYHQSYNPVIIKM